MAKKTLYFDSFCGYIVCVIAENGKVCGFNFEKLTRRLAVGDIYKGKVESVLPGMQAAFINCGLERNCYCAFEDFLPAEEKVEVGKSSPSVPELKVGDEVPVQVVKLPVGKKGAKVTTRLSFVGKCIIYLPDYPFIGVSRKITDEELRLNLAYSAKRLTEDNEGLIVRTAAPYANRNQINDEYAYLKNVSAKLRESFIKAKTGDLLYADVSLPVRVLRDTLSTDIEEIRVGSQKLKEHIESLVKLYPANSPRPVVLHEGGKDMLDELGVNKQLAEIISPRVDLDNGAYIIIEKTEAMTVIDVNTGKFTGDYNLEQTVYRTNIAAAREIARQVQLRNIGGIVVVDFIDMQDAAHNKALVEELEKSLKDDVAKCVVSPMSKFGLVEFTRKRVGSNSAHFTFKPCKHCQGAGYTLSDELVLLNVRSKLLNLAAEGAKSVRVDLNYEVFQKMFVWKEYIADLKSRLKNAAIYAVPHRTYDQTQINYRTNGFEIPPDAVKLF